MVWQPNILNNCYEPSGGYAPRTIHQGLCPWTPLGDFRSPGPLCPHFQILAAPLPACRRLAVIFYRAMLCMRGTSRGPVSVCPSQVGVLLKWLDGSSWFVAWRLLSTSPTLCFKEIQVGLSAKITALLSGTFPKLRTWKISPRHIDRTCYQLSSRKVTTLRTR